MISILQLVGIALGFMILASAVIFVHYQAWLIQEEIKALKKWYEKELG